MGRAPCCTKVGLHRGPWTPREDNLLTKYIHSHGEGHWRSLPKKAGLLRCGKSCRLRWMNYLRPGIKRGNITPDEEDLIIRLHSLLGNRWSLIAGRLPGRTDNEIKNYWNTHLTKRLRRQGTDPKTHRKITPPDREHEHQNFLQRNKTSAATKTQVHTPKAARVRTAVKEDNLNPMFKDVPWCNLKESFATPSAVDLDHDHELVNASDLECFSCVPPTVIVDNSLEKLYEEYLQLLNNSSKEEDQVQLESFAESLFI